MSRKVLKYLILLAIALLIVAISSFWFGGPSFREKDVVFELEGPTQISSGEEVVYKLKYANETRSVLSDLEFNFYYPEGSTVIVDNEIIQDHAESFKIDQLAPGESGEKEFNAFVLGERGNIRVAKAVLSFRSGNLASFFEKNISLSTTIVSSPISMTLVAPPSTISNTIIEYILDYRNESEEDASNLIIEFDYPDGFSPTEIGPLPKTGNNIWQVELLRRGSGGRISVKGIITGREGDNKTVTATLKRKIGGDYVDYQRVMAVTVISNPILGLEIAVNKSPDYVASLGDRLSYVLKYSNNSNLSLFGMNLSVKLEGDMFDLSYLDTKGGLFNDSTKTITWDQSVVSDFGTLLPGARGEIAFSVRLKSVFSSLIPGSSLDRFVKVSSKLGTLNIPTGVNSPELAVTSSLITKISTQPSFNHSIYYNDPDLGSYGIFPMRAGEETGFNIHWILTNPGNEVNDVKIVAKLGPGVQWMDLVKSNVEGSQPVFNPNSVEVIWSIPKLPYGTGVFSDKYESVFRVRVRPGSNQTGTILPIVQDVGLKGKDSFTGQDIIINRGSLDSNSLTDRPREGAVQ